MSVKRCDFCGKEESVLRVQQIIGNESSELNLCETCARKKGILTTDKEVEHGIGWLLQELFDHTLGRISDATHCSSCGTLLKHVKTLGRVGCSQCYFAFRREIARYLKRTTDDIYHRGRYPRRLETYRRFLVERAELKEDLKAALAREDYEKAAVLRDRLRNIEDDPGGED